MKSRKKEHIKLEPTTEEEYLELSKQFEKDNTALIKVPSGAVFKMTSPNMFNLIGMESLPQDADKRTEARYIVSACLEEPKIDVDEILDADLMALYIECLKFSAFKQAESFLTE